MDNEETSDGEIETEKISGSKLGRRAGIFKTFISYLWKEKMWWMIPMIIILVGFSLMAYFAGSAGIAPFVYTLF